MTNIVAVKDVKFEAHQSSLRNGWCVYITQEDSVWSAFQSGPYTNEAEAQAEAALLNNTHNGVPCATQ